MIDTSELHNVRKCTTQASKSSHVTGLQKEVRECLPRPYPSTIIDLQAHLRRRTPDPKESSTQQSVTRTSAQREHIPTQPQIPPRDPPPRNPPPPIPPNPTPTPSTPHRPRSSIRSTSDPALTQATKPMTAIDRLLARSTNRFPRTTRQTAVHGLVRGP